MVLDKEKLTDKQRIILLEEQVETLANSFKELSNASVELAGLVKQLAKASGR